MDLNDMNRLNGNDYCEGDEEDLFRNGSSEAVDYFDLIVGQLEDILIASDDGAIKAPKARRRRRLFSADPNPNFLQLVTAWVDNPSPQFGSHLYFWCYPLSESYWKDENFQKIQRDFLDKYCLEFDDTEENKLSYMEIFDEYVSTIERNIEQRLKLSSPDFSMERFQNELEENKDSLDGEVFEMLYTLSDFVAFKSLMLDFKAIDPPDNSASLKSGMGSNDKLKRAQEKSPDEDIKQIESLAKELKFVVGPHSDLVDAV